MAEPALHRAEAAPISEIVSQVVAEARQVIGRLDAHLRYDADEILAEQRAVDFCANVSRRLATAHDAVNRGFFRG